MCFPFHCFRRRRKLKLQCVSGEETSFCDGLNHSSEASAVDDTDYNKESLLSMTPCRDRSIIFPSVKQIIQVYEAKCQSDNHNTSTRTLTDSESSARRKLDHENFFDRELSSRPLEEAEVRRRRWQEFMKLDLNETLDRLRNESFASRNTPFDV